MAIGPIRPKKPADAPKVKADKPAAPEKAPGVKKAEQKPNPAARAFDSAANLVEKRDPVRDSGRHPAYVPVSSGALGWVSEGAAAGTQKVAKGVARGLSAIAQSSTVKGIDRAASRLGGDAAPRVGAGLKAIAASMEKLGEVRSTTVRELLRDPFGGAFSNRVLGKGLEWTAEASVAWNGYVAALTALASKPSEASLAAEHAAGVAGDLAKAAAFTMSKSATQLGEYGVKLAGLGVHAAEQGLSAARELAILSGRFSAKAAELIAKPDQGSVKAVFSAFATELKPLLKQSPRLAELGKSLAAA